MLTDQTMFLQFHSSVSLWKLLVTIILINSIGFVQSTSGLVNLPINASWAQNATTVAGKASGVSGSSNSSLNFPCGIAITTDDVLYVTDWNNNRVVMVDLTSLAVMKTFGSGPGSSSNQFDNPVDVFVINASVYILDSNNNRIQKYSTNGTNPSTLPGSGTYGTNYFMFIDKYNNIYISLYSNNKVIRFISNSASSTLMAGTGSAGAGSDELSNPYGIFVNDNLTMYIADTNNNRIQKWISGAISGTIAAGDGTAGNSLARLSYPTAVVLDQNGYMYIVDSDNNRIVRWASNANSGVCIVGCTGTSGTNAYQFNFAYTLAFDSSGSLYVTDADNNRVQKFQILENQTASTVHTTSVTTIHTTHIPTTLVTSIHTTHIPTTLVTSIHTTHIPTTSVTSIHTTHIPTTVQTSSSTTTTKILTNTKLSNFMSSKLKTTVVSPTILPETTMMNPITTAEFIDTSEVSSTVDHPETSISSTLTTTVEQTTVVSTTILPEATTMNPITTAEFIDTSEVFSTVNDIQTSESSTISSVIKQTTVVSTEILPETTTMNPITTVEFIDTSEVFSTVNYPQTSISSTLTTTVGQTTVVSTKILPETTMMNPTTTSQLIATSKVSFTVDNPQTSILSILTTTVKSTPEGSTKILSITSTMNPVTSLKSTDSSQMSSTVNLIQTSESSTISSVIKQTTVVSTTILPETTMMNSITTSQLIDTTKVSSTIDHSQTSILSTLTTTVKSMPVVSTKTLSITSTMNPTTSLKSIDSSQISSTVNLIQTSESSTISPIIKQTTLTLTTPVVGTTMINPRRSSQSVDTSQIPSTVNHIQTSESSTILSTIKQSSMISITTLNPSGVTSTMLSTSNDQQTSQQTNIISTEIVSTSSPSIFTSSAIQTTEPLIELLSTQSTVISTVSSTIYSSTTTRNRLNCLNPIISLSPNNPSVTTPLKIQRSQEFSISSTLQINCTQSSGVVQQWSIEKCLNSNCSVQEQVQLPSLTMTLGELYIPSKTLQYGIYRMKLTVQMSVSSQLTAIAMTFVNIVPSSIEVRLIQFGPSIITRGQQQTLILDPGTFSIDPDQIYFNSSNWNYTYYCQIYNNEIFPNTNKTMLAIDDTTINPIIPSCFENSTGNETLWKYGSNSSRSSLIIYGGSLQSNRTYHFQVELNSILNPSIISNGDLLVQIEDDISMTIIINCIISSMCISINEYQLINPTTQIQLTSFCIDNCLNSSSHINIEWAIYYGIINSTNNFLQWITLENTTQYINSSIFGINSNDLTMTTDILLLYSTIKYWRFEVSYSIESMRSTGLIDFMINSPPTNGSCSIYPLNGTIITLFTINCFNWFDENGIKDYSFYTWTSDPSNRLMLGYTTSTSLQVRVPINNLNSSLIHLLVRVRDIYDCTTELDLSSISVIPDTNNILSLMTTIESAVVNSDFNSVIGSNSLINTLYSGNQNDVCQVLTSFAQISNILAQQNLQLAINNNISPLSISISSLNQNYSELNNRSQIINNNTFNLTDYTNQLNTLASVQEYLMLFINNLTITTIDSIILQGSTLSQLTATTNQLTRNALTIASTKCNDLSLALLNNAQMIAYEDVLTAATSIAQCVSNVLTAANAPLQERTIILDLDTTRANALPTYYDTDLDSVWSNPNLFADSDDFSEETIDKNRNIYYQKQTASQVNTQFDETLKMITNALNVYLNIEQNVSINTSSIIMSLKKISSNTISSQTINLNDKIQIGIPEGLHLNSTKNSTISLRCVQTPLSVAGNQIQETMNLSNLLLVTFVDEDSEEVQVNITNNKPIEFFIARDINLIIPSMTMQNVSSITIDPSINNRQFNLHFINITQINPNISLSIHFEMHPLNNTLGYMLIYKFDGIPQLNSFLHQIDGWSILCPQNLTNDDLFIYFIDNEKTFGHQSTIFGIRELNSTEFEMSCGNMSSDLLINDQFFNFSSNYELRIFTSGCYYLDSNNNWQSNGLLVGSLTDHNRTQCFTSHLTSFASGFLVLPEPINWNYVFSNAGFLKNKTIYLTVIIIIIIFISIAIYARHLDNKDNQKLDVTVLSDNQSNEKYFYQIVIFTGIWKNSGTTAKVHFILSGDNHETNIRSLANPERKPFQRGSIDSFIFGVPKPLGLLNYLRIWHDNSGKDSLSSSWFLKYIIVRDLQTMEKSYFICQQWLSSEKGDKKIERILPVSNDEQMQEFVYSLPEKAYYKLSDSHLWFSIFSQPPTTKFTRVQRCICCFVLLFTVMLLNILYYDQSSEANTDTKVDGLLLGPFYFTSQQIIIGIIVDILIFIPSTFLVTFFRRIQQHRSSKQNSRMTEALSKIRENQSFQPITTTMNTFIQVKKKKRLLFPWWCLFIAYGVSFILMIMSIVLIIARGIEFGDTKIQKWLASLITAFFSSVFLSQPIKVLCLAIFLAIMAHRSLDEDEESNKFIDENEEFYLNGGLEHIQSIENNTSITSINSIRMHYLNKKKVAAKRLIRLKEIEMWSYIQHLLIYSCYLCILYVVSYANRNPNSYQQVSHLRNYFLNPTNSTYNYMKILTIDDYWKWLEDSFVSNIRAQTWYNGDQPQGLSGLINDKANRLIGWPVMRQLRIKADSTCQVPELIRQIIPNCQGDYSLSNEDHQSWFPGWKLTNDNISYSQSIQNAFIYQSGFKIESYKYRGIFNTYDDGGYIYEFRGLLNEMKENLTTLRQLSWIDSLTRAIIIEITLYNPNVELFTSVTFLIEIFSTGGIFPQSRFDPIDLHNEFQGFSSILHSIFSIIYMLFILYFTFIEIQSLIKLKKNYFSSIWCFIQWGTIICSWTGLGIYIWRFYEGSRVTQLFHQTNGYQYLNIQMAVYLDEVLTFLFAFCCFFGTIKSLYLFRFNSRLSQFAKTLQYVGKDLLCFAWTFSIVFIAFISLFYSLFFSKIWSCSDFYHTAEMLFQMLLLKFNTQDLYQADTFLGPLVFSLFIYFLVFICCTMIISIINAGFRHIRRENKTMSNQELNQDVLLFILQKMKRVLGIKQKNQVGCQETENSLQQLANKIDQFAIVLNRLNIISANKTQLPTVRSSKNCDVYIEDV